VVLRSWTDRHDASTVTTQLGRVHPLLRRLAPDVAHAAGLEVPAGAADELEGRFAAGDALGRLVASNGSRPLLVVEDLHHADAGTRAMAEPIAEAVRAAGGVVLVSSRTRAPAVSLTTLPGAAALDLGPLDPDVAAAIVAAIADGLPSDAIERIVERADGNPFFLTELGRLATNRTARSDSDIPPSVQEVVLRRVDALASGAATVLSAAALAGPSPDPALLARVAGGDDVVGKAIDAAVEAGLLTEERGQLRWSHDLVREALVAALPSVDARRIHAAIAEALRHEPGDGFALAHHLLAAGADPVDAATSGERAAALAADQGAFEDAVRWVARTRAVAERTRERADRAARLDAIEGRSLVVLGDHAAGRARLVAAAEHLLAQGEIDSAIEALLAIGSGRLRGQMEWEPPPELLHAVLEEAEARPDLRSRLLGRLSDITVDRETSERLADEALAAGREAGGADELVHVLVRRLITWRQDPAPVRRAALAEIRAIAPQASPDGRFEADASRALLLLEEGQLDELEPVLGRLNATVARRGLTRVLAFDTTASLVLVLRGRFEDAEHHLDEAMAHARGAVQLELLVVQALHVGLIQLLQGDLGAALAGAEMHLTMAGDTPRAALVHCVRALAAATAGQAELAHQSVDEVWRRGVDVLFDMQFGIGAALGSFLAEAVALLGDGDRAGELERRLLPWVGRLVVGGMAPSITLGAGDHVLALLAHARGDLLTARHRIASAVDTHRAMGAPPLLARSLTVAAELALEAADEAGAEAAAREAGRLSARFGLQLLGERAATALATLGAAPVPGVRVGGAPVALVFTDIESSTATAAALGDAAWLEQLRAHDTLVRRLVAQRGGREVKHLGDGFLLTFPGAGAAVDFARDLQTALDDSPVRVRVGVHSGPVLEQDGDVFGTVVNVASRVASAASGGEVLITDEVRRLLPDMDDVIGPGREATLKGVPEPVTIHPVRD
jgi:class 3 adenylate cyclase